MNLFVALNMVRSKLPIEMETYTRDPMSIIKNRVHSKSLIRMETSMRESMSIIKNMLLE